MKVEFKNMTGLEARQFHGPFTHEENGAMTIAFLQSAFVWNVTIDGELACVIGLAPPTLMSDRAYIWLYHTVKAESHKFLMVRYSQRFVEKLLNTYSLLTGHCIVDGTDQSTKSIRWLRWLGAEFGEPEGKKIPFQIRKKNG